MLLLKIRTGLNPGNEARPINPLIIPHSPLSFFGSRFISRAARTGLSLLRKQTETLVKQVISDVPLLPEIFRSNDSTQKAVLYFNIPSNRVIRDLSVNGPSSNLLPFYMMYTSFKTFASLLTAAEMHCLLNRNQSQKWNVSSTLESLKIHLLALLGPFTDPNDRFPYPFIHPTPEKDTPFGRSLPVIQWYRP